MIKLNKNYLLLQKNYLFAEVANRVNDYSKKNPEKNIIRLGIGDVTEPLPQSVIKGLQEAVFEMGKKETFKGYCDYEGYEFLRHIINESDFKSRGVKLDDDEIFISSGAKEDTANFQELFDNKINIAIPDPVYTVYLESNIMAGRAGKLKNGRFSNIYYLDSHEGNNFKPSLPNKKIDLIYLCFPNNPTGQTLTKDELAQWVNYARKNKSLILFDAAYEAFIREDNVPHSIFEIDGAKEVAVEFRSLSKTAGFTGTRCSYTIIPKELFIYDDKGRKHSLNKLWLRRQSTKFNGTAYIIQKGAYQVFTDQGKKECTDTINYYLTNAKIIKDGLAKLGIKSSGGINSPYIWLKVPGNLSSWEFFDKLLNECQVVGTPGSGFGKCGEGYFRLTSFGKKENVETAMQRISSLKF